PRPEPRRATPPRGRGTPLGPRSVSSMWDVPGGRRRRIAPSRPRRHERTRPMSTTGFDIFDRTVQKTNVLLKELGEALHMEDTHDAYLSLRAVLHALRDRLHPAEAAQLAAQLP